MITNLNFEEFKTALGESYQRLLNEGWTVQSHTSPGQNNVVLVSPNGRQSLVCTRVGDKFTVLKGAANQPNSQLQTTSGIFTTFDNIEDLAGHVVGASVGHK